MKKRQGFLFLSAVLSFYLVTACAPQTATTPPCFDAQPIQGSFASKADHLYFILDASSSMDEQYAGQSKFDAAKAIVANFNQTMPDLNLQAALRGFGLSPEISHRGTVLFYGPQAYTRAGLAAGLDAVSQSGGPSPMGKALAAAAADLNASQGPVAVVLVSDGKNMGDPEMEAANCLINKMGGRLCLYTVLVGDDPDGQALLQKIAAAAACGKFTSGDSLASGAGMAAFVSDVLLAARASDSDGDGVADARDRCPATPCDVMVNADGCPLPVATKSAEVTAAGTWIYSGIQFETNKADLKPGSHAVLDEIAAGLESQPQIKVEVQGHTDNTGKADYNMGLSEKRAQTVVRYLTDKGIASERLIAKGYGMNNPIATNATADGRARNRRVELKPLQ